MKEKSNRKEKHWGIKLQIYVILSRLILQNNVGKEESASCLLASHLQGELWSLCCPLHRSTDIGGQQCRVPLLRVAVRRHEITKALMETGSLSVHSKSIIQSINQWRSWVCTVKAVPVAWATGGIHRLGTGIVETSIGFPINVYIQLHT